MNFDLLVYLALVGVVIVIIIGALVIVWAGDKVDIETRKIRFAAATFTGILMLFIFSAVLYYADIDDSGRGKDIFEKAVTAMTPLAGAIIGYLFGSRGTSGKSVNSTDRSAEPDQS